MATRRWVPTATARPQIDSITVSGTPVAGNTGSVTIGNSTLTITAQSGTTTTSLVAAALKNAINARKIDENRVANESRNVAGQELPEFRDVEAVINPTNTSVVWVRSKVAGWPFGTWNNGDMTVASTGGGALTLARASVQTATGPNHWSHADNWRDSSDAVGAMVDGDAPIIANTDKSILFGMPTDHELQSNTAKILQSFTGWFGLPAINTLNGMPYPEYRTRYASFDDFDSVSARNPVFEIGAGAGAGSPLLNIALRLRHASSTGTFRIINTGRPQPGLSDYALNIATDTNHTSDLKDFFITKGSVQLGGEAFNKAVQIRELVVAQASPTDVSLMIDNLNSDPAGTMVFGGGTITLQGGSFTALASVEVNDGILHWNTGSSVTAFDLLKGRFYPIRSGTITTLTIGKEGELNANVGGEGFTITNLDMLANAKFIDDNDILTVTTGPDLVNCGAEDVTLRRGKNWRATKATIT
jgi:hypothetical protein